MSVGWEHNTRGGNQWWRKRIFLWISKACFALSTTRPTYDILLCCSVLLVHVVVVSTGREPTKIRKLTKNAKKTNARAEFPPKNHQLDYLAWLIENVDKESFVSRFWQELTIHKTIWTETYATNIYIYGLSCSFVLRFLRVNMFEILNDTQSKPWV